MCEIFNRNEKNFTDILQLHVEFHRPGLPLKKKISGKFNARKMPEIQYLLFNDKWKIQYERQQRFLQQQYYVALLSNTGQLSRIRNYYNARDSSTTSNMYTLAQATPQRWVAMFPRPPTPVGPLLSPLGCGIQCGGRGLISLYLCGCLEQCPNSECGCNECDPIGEECPPEIPGGDCGAG